MASDDTREYVPRVLALRSYMRALEQGDLDAVATIARFAETDEALERMLLAVNEAYLGEAVPAAHESASLAFIADTGISKRTTEASAPRIGSQRHRRLPSPRWLGTLVAALLLIALIGGFFALFTGHGSTGPQNGSHTPTAATHPTAPALGSPTIIVGKQESMGHVYALSGSGSVIWDWSDGSVDTFVVSSDTVFVASHAPGSEGGASRVTAFRASDGYRLWQVMALPLAGYTYMALDGDTLVVDSGYGDGTVYGLDIHSGGVRWRQPDTSGLSGRLITAADGQVYTINDKGFSAYDTHSGKFRWSLDDGYGTALTTGTNGPSVVAGDGGLLYYYIYDVVSTYPAGTPYVTTIDVATGAIRQRLTRDTIGNPVFVTANGVVYTAKGGQFCAYRIAKVERLWCSASIDGLNTSLRLVASSHLLLYSRIVSNQVEVGALDDATGKRVWSWNGPSTLFSADNSMSLSGDRNTLYLATRQGMYAFAMSSGHVLWHALPSTDFSFVQPALFH
jgi:PQQ-like domain